MRFSITAKNFALVSTGLLCLTVAACAIVITHNARLLLNSAKGSTDNSAAVTGKLNSYLTPDVLRDLHNDLTASVGTGQLTANSYAEVAKSTSNAINRHVAPGIDRIVGSVEGRMGTLDKMIAHFDERAFAEGGLMQTTTAAVKDISGRLSVGLDEIVAAVRAGVDAGVLTVQQANRLLANPDIPRLVKSLADGGEGLVAVEASLKKNSDDANQAVKNFSQVTALWAKYTATANKWQKWVTLARIVGLLGGLPLPY